jgi:uncharacterized protein (TIGR03546 family)
MFLWKIVLKILKVFSCEDKPWQLGLGFAFGVYFGLSSSFSWYNFIPLVLLLLLNVSIGSAFLALLITKPLGLILAPLVSNLGAYLLGLESLQGFWTSFFNLPVLALMQLNHTYRLGGFIASSFLFIPLAFGFAKFMSYYQKNLKEKIAEAKWFKAAKSSKFFFWVFKLFSFFV